MKLLLPLTLLSLGTACAQGPLTPPNTTGPEVGPTAPLDGSGNPQPAMKTLHQVEPRIPLAGGTIAHVISQPGSYYLTANISQSGTSNGITVNAQNVTLDLNGFAIIGNGTGFSICGILVTANHFTVMNGSLRGWSGFGLQANGESNRVENIRSHDNPGSGMYTGKNAWIHGCQFRNNTASGMGAGDNSVVRNCNAVGNGFKSIVLGANCLAEACITSGGFSGIEMGDGGTVRFCSAAGADAIGIATEDNGTVSDCSVEGSTGTGFGLRTMHGSKVERCRVTGSTVSNGIGTGNSSIVTDCLVKSCSGTFGIKTGTDCMVTGCQVSENSSTVNESGGISVLENSSVIDCNVSRQTNTGGLPTERMGAGIIAANMVTIRGCTTYRNHGAGIVVGSLCSVIGNTCNENGPSTGNGPGIFSASFNNRIEGNTLQFNDTGIRLTSFPNVVIRNVSRNNGWTIAAGNRVAPMVTMAATAAAISGTSGGLALGTTDPNANLMY
ncbi:right-handed parallel beta-helix repeat-containing protein [Luteolibacter sp. GHJ8]|uniref:Right-handed parallel beta-helix repeat-containing protein n=1 Tax=Luteolibacter rhizosphaerae TaxID=2989719 RepID=A0ABT3G4L6_9BACT|nr:right-handed parallel beta-helix repeat-containing protein [Luteolibacter rhizosphaerae]MCW1914150.1 right-handed parallel beta-helix repeat-containing protein [Luteolibacter rhizosphaerae]